MAVELAPLPEPSRVRRGIHRLHRAAQRRHGGAAARQIGVRRRALPHHARAQGRAGRGTTRSRRWSSTRWTRGSAGRSARRWRGAGRSGGAPAGAGDHPSAADRRPGRSPSGRFEGVTARRRDERRPQSRTARTGWTSWRGCWATRRATRLGGTRRRCSGRETAGEGGRGAETVSQPFPPSPAFSRPSRSS